MSSLPAASFCLCLLFLFHLYKKEPPNDNKAPPNKDPITAPIIAVLFDLSDCCAENESPECVGDGDSDGVGDANGVSDDDGVEG